MKQGSVTMRATWILLGAAAVTGGCANAYLDAKRRTAPGGEIDVQTQAAQSDLDRQRAHQTALQKESRTVDAQIRSNDQRIQSLQTTLRQQQQTLAKALKDRKISQARHDDLKRQLDAAQADTSAVQLQNQGKPLTRSIDPQASAAQEQQLKDLEKRKQDLEAVLANLAK